MAARDVRKNLNLFVDGKGYAGQIEEFTPPPLATKNEEFRGGGMDAPINIDMGMERLETSFTLISYDRDILALYGVAQGNAVAFVAREALQSFDGTVTAVVHTMRGKIDKLDSGTVKAGDKAGLQVTMTLTYYKLQHGDKTPQEIDVENMIHKVNGVDVLAAKRSAIGL
jgi:P2 family phage contractile tail tube protein